MMLKSPWIITTHENRKRLHLIILPLLLHTPVLSLHSLKFLTLHLCCSIAQVVQSSGCEVPQWMLEMKKPSKNEKRRLTTQQPERGHVSHAVQHERVVKRRRK